jgi:hypothetical protein
MTWTARALIFSGRPDPTWALPESAQHEFESTWARLLAVDSVEPVPPPVLGYRGVEVDSNDGRTWIVTRGIATMTKPTSSARRDDENSLERLVLSTAPPGSLPPGAVPSSM